MKPIYWIGPCLILCLVAGAWWLSCPSPIELQPVAQRLKPHPLRNQEGTQSSSLELSTPVARNETSVKLQVLREIFKSKNDNDPRLDRDFNQLTEQAKEALKLEYQQLNLESRNEKGTIVFLLGRNMTSVQDLLFFKKVVSEEPCLSLSNCKAGSVAHTHAEVASGMQITLEYPQIVALKALEIFLNKSQDVAASNEAVTVIREASKSKSAIVSQLAEQLLSNRVQKL